MVVLLVLAASLGVGLSNLALRKHLERGGESSQYFAVQLPAIFLISLLGIHGADLLHPHPFLLAWSVLSGLLFYALMHFLGRAVQSGPAGLTFAVLNASTVFPAALMALWPGKQFGFSYELMQVLGATLIVGTLFFAVRQERKEAKELRWALYTGALFLTHILLLLAMQWRGLWIQNELAPRFGMQINPIEANSTLYMPLMFLTASICQLAAVGPKNIFKIPASTWKFGPLGACANGVGTFCLLLALRHAEGISAVILYPLYAVATLLFCNFWARYLYQEKVRWGVLTLCSTGIMLASITI